MIDDVDHIVSPFRHRFAAAGSAMQRRLPARMVFRPRPSAIGRQRSDRLICQRAHSASFDAAHAVVARISGMAKDTSIVAATPIAASPAKAT